MTPCVFRSITQIEDPRHWGQLRVAGWRCCAPLVNLSLVSLGNVLLAIHHLHVKS